MSRLTLCPRMNKTRRSGQCSEYDHSSQANALTETRGRRCVLLTEEQEEEEEVGGAAIIQGRPLIVDTIRI